MVHIEGKCYIIVVEKWFVYLQAPHRSPSIVIFRTSASNSFMSVSSSHGLTSNIMLDLAMRAGSENITLQSS